MCVHVGVCPHSFWVFFFFLHMGAIWSFVIPCSHTSGFLLICGCLVFVDKVYFGAKTFLVVVLQRTEVRQYVNNMSENIIIDLSNDWMVLSPGKTSDILISHVSSLLQHPV